MTTFINITTYVLKVTLSIGLFLGFVFTPMLGSSFGNSLDNIWGTDDSDDEYDY